MNNTWNETQFITFLMLYAANIDAEFSLEEQEKIKEVAKGDIFIEMTSQFDRMTDYQALETILSYKGLYYPTSERKEALLSKINELFFADGEYSVLEKGLFNFLNRLM